MRRDGMGRGVAWIYAKRREVLDQYVPMWVMPGQGVQPAGQGTNSPKPLETKAGQGGRAKQGTQTTVVENERKERGGAVRNSASRAYGPEIHPVHPVHPVQANNGAASVGQGTIPPASSTLSALPPWTDDRTWCALLHAAGDLQSRRAVLRDWAEAAGGRSGQGALHLPTTLPCNFALATLRAHARGLGLAMSSNGMPFCDVEVERLLAAGQRAANSDLAADPAEIMLRSQTI